MSEIEILKYGSARIGTNFARSIWSREELRRAERVSRMLDRDPAVANNRAALPSGYHLPRVTLICPRLRSGEAGLQCQGWAGNRLRSGRRMHQPIRSQLYLQHHDDVQYELIVQSRVYSYVLTFLISLYHCRCSGSLSYDTLSISIIRK